MAFSFPALVYKVVYRNGVSRYPARNSALAHASITTRCQPSSGSPIAVSSVPSGTAMRTAPPGSRRMLSAPASVATVRGRGPISGPGSAGSGSGSDAGVSGAVAASSAASASSCSSSVLRASGRYSTPRASSFRLISSPVRVSP